MIATNKQGNDSKRTKKATSHEAVR